MRYIVFFFGGLLFLLCPQEFYASCGAATCPLNNYHYLRAGWFGLNLIHEYINQDVIYVGSFRSFVGAIRGDHDEVETLNERTVLQLQYGIWDNFDMSVDLPFVHREHSHIHHDAGGDQWESWNFNGLGDMVIAGHFALLQSTDQFEPNLSLSGVLKLPTGVTNAKSATGEEAEVTIQPGTGSLDAAIGVNYRQTLAVVPMFSEEYSALPIIVGITYQVNGKGKDDYRVGNILLAHIGTAYQFSRRGSFLLQVNGRFQGFADVGKTDEPRGNTGGTWIYLSPGIGVQLADGLAGACYTQIPVYQNVHGIQQTSKFNLLFSLSYSFNLQSTE